MLDKVNKEVLSFLFKGELPSQNANAVSEAKTRKREKLELSKAEAGSGTPNLTRPNPTQSAQAPVETMIRQERKIGRNERVKIKNIGTGEEKEVKYKQAIPLIEQGKWVLID